MNKYFVYVLSSKNLNVLYIGVTSDLVKRVYQHKSMQVEGFTYKYNVDRLVYYEGFERIEDAILREKRLKKWKRAWKNQLVESINKGWNDLYPELLK